MELEEWSKQGFLEFVEISFGPSERDQAESFLRSNEIADKVTKDLYSKYLQDHHPDLLRDAPLLCE